MLISYIKRCVNESTCLLQRNGYKFRSNGGRRKKDGAQLGFHKLEGRDLLAGIFLNAAVGDLFVFGDSSNDTGSVTQVNASTIEVNIAGADSQSFSVNDFDRLVFIGFGGDDTFVNNSSVTTLLLGNDGNDQLTGGSGADEINGGQGDDVIDGRGGADRLIANGGNDTVEGGDGDDRIFGTAGINTINAGDGDDIVFGGNEADTINGGEGIDQIFGLGGDDILSSGNGGIQGSQNPLEFDLILGLDGNDTITGGNGLNVFFGGNGNDVLTGGSSSSTENRLHGQDGDDQLTGGAGQDFFTGGRDDDVINAGAGFDTIAFTSPQSDFSIIGSTERLIVTSNSGNEGVDTITGADQFLYSLVPGGTVVAGPAEPSAALTIRVQPIVVSNTDGSNQATFFGTPEEALLIEEQIDRIYAAAGIDIEFVATETFNNTVANVGTTANRPGEEVFDIVEAGAAAGIGNRTDSVIDIYFVRSTPGAGVPTDFVISGQAIDGDDGVAVGVGSQLPTFEGGRNAIARVVAHEIGHNLGLLHVTATANLLFPNGDGTDLTGAQISTVLGSRFVEDA